MKTEAPEMKSNKGTTPTTSENFNHTNRRRKGGRTGEVRGIKRGGEEEEDKELEDEKDGEAKVDEFGEGLRL